MSALEKVLKLAGTAPQQSQEDPASDLVLALSTALDGVRVYLASSDSDDDGDDDKGGKDDDGDADDIENSATYKALIKKGVAPKLARAMALKAAKKVAASALAESACVILAGLTEARCGAGTGADLSRPDGRPGRPARGERVRSQVAGRQGLGIAGRQLPDGRCEACALGCGACCLPSR